MTKNLIQSQSPRPCPLDKDLKTVLKKTDRAQFEEFLQDASRMALGKADAVLFAQTETQISNVLREAHEKKTPLTIAGNHTGLVGGAVPLGGEVLATHLMTQTFPQMDEDVLEIIQGRDELSSIPYQFYLKRAGDQILAVVPPGLRLGEFQKRIEEKAYFYPPDPTETNAFLGATVATNASGARTFKYGATRPFVQGLRIALAQGDILEIKRGKIFSDVNSVFRIERAGGKPLEIRIPAIRMPRVKHAAGYFCQPAMDLIDLWIGSEGTLGVITEIELSLRPRPQTVMGAIAFFPGEGEAIAFVRELRDAAHRTWAGKDIRGLVPPPALPFHERRPYGPKTGGGIDIRAIEYFDSPSLNLLRQNPQLVRTSPDAEAAIFFEQESSLAIRREELESRMGPLFENRPLTPRERQALDDHPFGRMMLLLKERGVLENLELAFPGEEKAQRNLRQFRHALPLKVNEIIGENKRRSGLAHLAKVATDTATPDECLEPMMTFFKETLQKSAMPYVIFGHIGNNHLHANLLPRDEKELKRAGEIYLELCRWAVAAGGTVSAEHGIGKLKHQSLEILYGKEGWQAMRRLKTALDPQTILGRGNIFPI